MSARRWAPIAIGAAIALFFVIVTSVLMFAMRSQTAGHPSRASESAQTIPREYDIVQSPRR